MRPQLWYVETLTWTNLGPAAPAVPGGADPQQGRQRAEQWKERWDKADANHDGMLSREEMRQGMPRLARHFDRLDRDGNGEVTPEELRAAFQARKHQRQGGSD